MRRTVLRILELYQLVISPLYTPCCRFDPSCSQYAREAVERFGVWRGLVLALYRLIRCHPLCAGGYDPVPETFGLARLRRNC